MSKKAEARKRNKKDTDKTVDEMLKNWDKIKCHICGKEISMLDAVIVNRGEYFICKEHRQ